MQKKNEKPEKPRKTKKHGGFLTDWERRYISGEIEVKDISKRRVYNYRIKKKIEKAREDFELVMWWLFHRESPHILLPNLSSKDQAKYLGEESRFKDVKRFLSSFSVWGKPKRDSLVIPVECPYCQNRFNLMVSRDKKGRAEIEIHKLESPRKVE